MNKLFRILIIYFIILNLLFGNSQTKEVRTFETLKNPRIFEQLLSEDYSKWKKEKNNVSPNLVSEKRGRRVLGSAYSLRSDLTGGMLDSNGNINVFKDGNLTATAGSVGAAYFNKINSPDELAGWGNSISINFIGGISGSFSAEFSKSAAGFSGSIGTGGPASGTVTYQLGYTYVGENVSEILKKLPISSKNKEILRKELEKAKKRKK